jgi:transposase InsO family protein
MVYIDDIIIASRSEEEHVVHLQQMFDRLRQYGLRLNPSKCAFGLREVKLLGYIVSAEGLKADPGKVQAIARLDAPTSVSEVRSFLGMTGYYRTCIPGYAHVSEPLVQLTRKNAHFVWTGVHQQAFEDLKSALMSERVMAHPQTDKEYYLYTDACDYAVGAILVQKDDEGVERPIVYLSKQLSATQRRWATIEKEAYAVVYALKQLRPYLWGARYKTFTDHKPLTSLFTKDMNNTKIQRWAVLLAEYGCRVEYHKGKLNVRADMLSRIRQRDEVATFDTEDWKLGDELPPLPPDEQDPDVYGLNLRQVSEQQKQMTEWTEQHNEDSHYMVIEGLLYSTKKPHVYAPEHPRLVLRPAVREHVVSRAHAEVGHMSVVKTMRKVQEAFVWPGMKRYIQDYVSKCPTCIVHSRQQPRAHMGEMPIATQPVQIIAADLIGPLVRSDNGNTYTLTVIDHCTGWAEAYPIPSKTSEAVWPRLIRDYFPRHSYPSVLITDLGLEFGALALRQYLQAVGVEHRRTTAYNPQANGRCERFNKTLKHLLMKLMNNQRHTWEDQLGAALLAYNNALSDVTGQTPYFLHYGRRARLPISRLLGQNPPLEGRLQDVAEALRQAAGATLEARKYNRERLNARANQKTFRPGDTVVIKAMEPLSMTSRWDPQWTVTRVRGKVLYLSHQQTGKSKVLNVNKVRLVDPNIVWDEVQQRPKRNPHISARPREPLLPPQQQKTKAVKRPRVGGTTYQPRAPARERAPKRRRGSSPDVAQERPPQPGNKTGQADHTGQSDLDHHQVNTPATATVPHSHTTTGLPTATRTPAIQRRAPQDLTSKRHRRKAPRRPHAADDGADQQPRKRWRPYLPRAVKRPLQQDFNPPGLGEQKRARLQAIYLVHTICNIR